jgi:ribosomal protein L31E
LQNWCQYIACVVLINNNTDANRGVNLKNKNLARRMKTHRQELDKEITELIWSKKKKEKGRIPLQ